MERITLTLRGPDGQQRTFVSAQDTTLEHDVWMMPHVEAAGLHQTNLNDPSAVLQRALSSGRVFLLLAGSVLEVGVPWSAAAMDANAAWFASLTDRESKAQIHSALVQLLLSFFSIGTALSTTSPNSSRVPASPRRGDDDGSDPAPPVPSLQRETTSIGMPAVAISSASGDTSSSSSPAVIPSA